MNWNPELVALLEAERAKPMPRATSQIVDTPDEIAKRRQLATEIAYTRWANGYKKSVR